MYRYWCYLVKFSILIMLVSGVLLVNGCGGGKSNSHLDRQVGEFRLNVWEDSLLADSGAGAFDLIVRHNGSITELDVQVTEASNLKALYFNLEFDPGKYNPQGVEYSDLLGTEDNLLTIDVLKEQGCLYSGQVVSRPQEAAGYSGSGVLATVRFNNEPQADGKELCKPPVSSQSQTILSQAGSLLEWYYYNAGDYDQNGEVNINDLTPMAMYLGDAATPLLQFPIGSIRSVVDGDSNGEINISDVTPIGAFFKSSVLGGYNVYATNDVATDYPADPSQFGDPPTLTGLANIPWSAAMGNGTSERLRFQAYAYTSLVNANFWVRPTDGTADGTPSNLVGGNTNSAIQFSVATAPATGSGSQPDPYIIGGSSIIDFVLYDPNTTSPIALTDPDVALSLDDPAAGALDASGQFTGNAAYTGRFAVYATYEHEPTNPQKICFYVTAQPPANNDPVAILDAAPTSGQVILPVVFNAGRSHDPDTGDAIQTIEWDFGEGAGYQALATVANYSYTAPGTYDASLRVTDTHGGTDTATVRITVAPVQVTGPTADLTATPLGGDHPLQVAFDASTSTPGSSPISTYEYDFLGNGAFLTGAGTANYTYNQKGTYRVTVRVTDGNGAFDTDYVDIVVTDPTTTPPPTGALGVTPDKGHSPLNVTFDFSGSTTGGTISYTLDPGDGGAAYTTAGTTQAHTYNASTNTTYTATLTVADSATSLTSQPVTVQVEVYGAGAILADLKADTYSGPAPLAVNFDGTSSSGASGTFTYDFDYENDGTWDVTGDSTGMASHTYNTNGVYTARMRITDSVNTSLTDEDTVQINVGGAVQPVPTASLVATPPNGSAPLAVTLDATGTTGGTPPYTFDFDYEDDGTYDITGNTSGSIPNTYSTAGTYTARVLVTDSNSKTATATANIEVTNPLSVAFTGMANCGLSPVNAGFMVVGAGGKAPLTYDFDWEDDGTYDVTGNTTGSVSHSYSTVGACNCRVRVTDSLVPAQSSTATAPVDVHAPLASSLVLSTSNGMVPPAQSVTLDATGSTGGHAPYTYEFDWDGDGVYETTGNTTGTDAASFTATGIYNPGVRVTDSCPNGPNVSTAFSAASVTITRNQAGGSWHVYYVAPITGDTNSYTGLTLVADNNNPPNVYPAISFYDATAGPGQGLYYIRANDSQGNAWPAAPTQVLGGPLGVHSSIKEVAGNPAIGFFDQTLVTLNYARAADNVGAIWTGPGSILATPDAPQCGSWCSMDFVTDPTGQVLPAISYIGGTLLDEYEIMYYGGQVRYVRSNDITGTAWNTPKVVDSAADLVFACTSLEYLDGNVSNWSPGVSYLSIDFLDPLNDFLKYSIAVDLIGDTWSRPGFPLYVEQSIPGPATSLELWQGRPWISWSFGGATTLHVNEGLTTDGATWLNPGHMADPANSFCGDWSSSEKTGAMLGTSYTRYQNPRDLWYVDTNTMVPTWNPAENVDVIGTGGIIWGTYLIEINGFPAISYYASDIEGDFLKYAVWY